MAAQILSAARVRDILSYDSKTGIFTWRVMLAHRRKPGDLAGSKTHGYIEIGIDNKSYRAHHLAWLYVHGEFPSMEIDHIDGNRENNAISNLRLATSRQNAHNKWNAHTNNASGFLGVTFHKQRGKWMAQIKNSGKNHNLGLFDTPEQAHAAYLHAKQKLHEFGEVAKINLGQVPSKRSTTDRSVSGYRGVSLDKRSGKWGARISIHGVYKSLGHFDTAEQANEACVSARSRANQAT